VHYKLLRQKAGQLQLSKKELRLQYSGFIIFSSQLLGLITGLIFTLLLTRSMKPAQYGVWTNIFDYTGYFILFSGLLPFWATRFVARGKEGTVKTSSLAQLIIALVSMAIYFPVIFLIYTLAIAKKIGTEAYLPIFLIAGLYILAIYMITVFESILQSIKPQTLGYGFLIEEVVKVSVALVLILGFKQLFLGAVLALVLSCFVQIGYYVSLLADEFKQKTNWSYLKEWLKGSTVLAYNAVGIQLLSFVFILLFFYGGPTTRAYYQAALSFAAIIGYAGSLATALYPKLLANTCTPEQVRTSFRTVMMLAIPLITIVMVMSVSFLTVLNIAYGIVWPVLIALSINTFIGLVYSFYSSCLFGVEAFDAGGKVSIRQLFRSKIFKVFTLPYIEAAVGLPLAYFVLTRLPVAGSVLAAVYVIVILIGIQLSTFSVVYWFMRRSISIPVAWVSIAKYVFAALLMAGIMLLLPATTTLLSTIAKAIAGFGIYVVLLLAIDKQARQLVSLIWEEIKGSVRQLTSKENNRNTSLGENSTRPTEN
jgi:O-antigen/teichoic acid export membrane protein